MKQNKKHYRRGDKVAVMIGCKAQGCEDGELRPGMPATVHKTNHAFLEHNGHSCVLGCLCENWGVVLRYFDPGVNAIRFAVTCYRNLINLED